MARAGAPVRTVVREELMRRIGRPPARVSGADQTRIDRRFVVEGVTFERWHIPGPLGEIAAWFLLPEPPSVTYPTVVALHPHGRQFEVGKSLVAGLVGDGTRAYGLAAAKAGFAVLAPDMLAFEDRRPPLAERKANYALQGESYERLLAMTALVQGATLQGWMLAELSACVDALERDPRVDAARVGVLGQSYGGQQALFGMIAESRFRAAVVSCGFSLVRLLVERRISHNLALYVPGLLPDLDFDVLVTAIAPRPLRVLAGRRDTIFPVEGVEVVEAAAKRAWAEAGAPEAACFHYVDCGHDLPADALAGALEWLGQCLGATTVAKQ